MELLIKVNSADGDKSYKDGDIVQAFSNDRILLANAQSICSVDNFNLDPVSGLRYNDTLLMKYMETSSLYRVERINATSARRINLLTSEEDIISNSPNLDGEAIWIEDYLARRLKSNIFGKKAFLHYELQRQRWRNHPRALWSYCCGTTKPCNYG